MSKRKTFTKEFKAEAVRIWNERSESWPNGTAQTRSPILARGWGPWLTLLS
jgi:hypothetical protein